MFRCYILPRSQKIFHHYCFKVEVNVIVGMSKSIVSFVTFLPFTQMNETTMSYFFHSWILLLLLDILCTAPPRLLIKVTTGYNKP